MPLRVCVQCLTVITVRELFFLFSIFSLSFIPIDFWQPSDYLHELYVLSEILHCLWSSFFSMLILCALWRCSLSIQSVKLLFQQWPFLLEMSLLIFFIFGSKQQRIRQYDKDQCSDTQVIAKIWFWGKTRWKPQQVYSRVSKPAGAFRVDSTFRTYFFSYFPISSVSFWAQCPTVYSLALW